MIINLLMKQCRKSAMMAKQKQMVNTADSSAYGKANPCEPTLHADLLQRLLGTLS